jgi:hypothetical protein
MANRLGTGVIAAHSRGPVGPVVRHSHSSGLEDKVQLE